MASEKKRKWAELSHNEQAEFKLHYVCTRDLKAAAAQLNLSPHSAIQIANNHKLDELADIAEAEARERIAGDAANWKVEAVAQVDELLGILKDGVRQLTAKAQIADVDKLIRLKAFLLGEPDSRAEVTVHGDSIIASIGDDPEAVKLLAGLAGRIASRPDQPGHVAP